MNKIILDDYIKNGENFDLAGDINNPLFIRSFNDKQIKSEINTMTSMDKLRDKDMWIWIFNDILLKRRIKKINKIRNGNEI